MANQYKDYLSKQLAPAWLRNPFGRAWHIAFGDALDQIYERARSAIKQRFPNTAAPDAVAAIGSERQIERGPEEGIDGFRERLLGAWDTWPTAGTAYGLLTALRLAGFTNCYLEIVQGKQYSLDSDHNLVITDIGGPWLIDADTDFWSKFTVIFAAPLCAPLASLPAESSETAKRVKRIIKKWKPAHATCSTIVLESDPIIGFPIGRTIGSGTIGSTAIVWTP